jgi:hypothetical protein
MMEKLRMWGCFTGGSVLYYDSCLTRTRPASAESARRVGVPRNVTKCRCGRAFGRIVQVTPLLPMSTRVIGEVALLVGALIGVAGFGQPAPAATQTERPRE